MVVTALAAHVQTLPELLRVSRTWDRGMELADHKRFTVATEVAVYFCDPQAPWQRGTNENTNGLLRQYFPKKTDLGRYNQADLDIIAAQFHRAARSRLQLRRSARLPVGPVCVGPQAASAVARLHRSACN
jgi:IS30 family transposase